MQFLNRHILVLGRLFLVIFILASSGFSVALTYCTMGDGDACLMASSYDDRDMSGSCESHASPHGVQLVAFSNSDPCMLTTVAGGLQTDPTTVEKLSIRQELAKLVVLPAALPVRMSNLVLDEPFTLFSSAVTTISPPSVEKYVLNATFRI